MVVAGLLIGIAVYVDDRQNDGDRGEILGALETLGVEFVNILGAGWASREPAAG